jgi:hypothetical protein
MPAAGAIIYDHLVTWLAARAAAFPPWLQDLALAVVLAAVNVGVALPYRAQLRPAGRGVFAPVTAHPLAGALALLILQCPAAGLPPVLAGAVVPVRRRVPAAV